MIWKALNILWTAWYDVIFNIVGKENLPSKPSRCVWRMIVRWLSIYTWYEVAGYDIIAPTPAIHTGISYALRTLCLAVLRTCANHFHTIAHESSWYFQSTPLTGQSTAQPADVLKNQFILMICSLSLCRIYFNRPFQF